MWPATLQNMCKNPVNGSTLPPLCNTVKFCTVCNTSQCASSNVLLQPHIVFSSSEELLLTLGSRVTAANLLLNYLSLLTCEWTCLAFCHGIWVTIDQLATPNNIKWPVIRSTLCTMLILRGWPPLRHLYTVHCAVFCCCDWTIFSRGRNGRDNFMSFQCCQSNYCEEGQ